MRCYCCNKPLSDYESTLRHAVSREFLDTCVVCLDSADIPYTGRPDLNKKIMEDTPHIFEEEEDE